MTPPKSPSGSFTKDNPALFQVGSWRRLVAAKMLGGLLTLPQFHANGIRIDWLLRLVLGHATGRKSPTRHDLDVALNSGMPAAWIASQEDPSEGFFCEPIVTLRGNFTLFPGQWENATAYTVTLLRAFEELPDSGAKQCLMPATRC